MDNTTEVSGSPEPTELDPVANQDEATAGQATAAEGEADQPKEQADLQEAKPPKTFTQEEVNEQIQRRLAKEARKHARELEQRLAALQQQPPKQQAAPPKPSEDDAQPQQLTREQVIEEAKKLAPQFAQQALEQQRQQAQLATFWERADEVAERFPDFDQAVRDPSFVELSGSIYEFVVESDVGPEMTYQLSKNRAKAREIARMSPMQAARALIAIESELKAKPKAQVSRAPDPVNPVGNRGSASRSSLPSDDDDIETWMRKDAERMRKAGLIR